MAHRGMSERKRTRKAFFRGKRTVGEAERAQREGILSAEEIAATVTVAHTLPYKVLHKSVQ